MLIDRDPQGKFIRNDEALRAWLPRMLAWADVDQLEQMLKIAAQWCCRNAQDRLRASADYIWSDPTWPNWTARQSAAWLKRVEILMECATRIKETR